MEQSKVCTKCKVMKPLDMFKKDSSKRDGLYSSCKECCSKFNKDNSEKIQEYAKRHYAENKNVMIAKGREYRKNNPDKLIESQRKYRENNREAINARRKLYYYSNIEAENEKSRKYKMENKDKIKIKNTEYVRNRKKTDSLFKLKQSVRVMINKAFYRTDNTKNSKSVDILGCSYEFLKHHIESQFVEGMTWENRSEWHIDHIIPMASAKTEEDVIRLNHYTNLQPLWAKDNLKKGAKF